MKKILLASTGIIISTGTAYAACIPTPSCSSLGYESSSSCEGGIKCPFGNAWNCTLADKITEITTEITEIKKIIQEGGTSSGNKNCAVGHIYYSDKTCSVSYDASKTPIGVVVYVDGQGHGQVMALKSIGSYAWQNNQHDIDSLDNFETAEEASRDFASCSNTKKIIADHGSPNDIYYAAGGAAAYKTEGTNAGDWCLPAAGIITSIYNNMELINTGYRLVSTEMGTNFHFWSSSEHDADNVWYSSFDSSYGLIFRSGSGSRSKYYANEVIPVLEF